jgi:hypothetical protein
MTPSLRLGAKGPPRSRALLRTGQHALIRHVGGDARIGNRCTICGLPLPWDIAIRVDKPPQVVGECGGSLVSPPGILFQTFRADCLDLGRNRVVNLPEWTRGSRKNFDQTKGAIFRRERRLAGDQCVEDTAGVLSTSRVLDRPKANIVPSRAFETAPDFADADENQGRFFIYLGARPSPNQLRLDVPQG